ncbi:zinc ribbon domain-containing protein [Pseudomonas putida]|uniref:zinc ribbon domain-containing protein n=1 Tax=Pseudomonas putida TaxID=303 RepID=UPI0023657556|nr:zinc ribbon domain-containing protein [Pseudomonas putida]MDD2047770.1 zinc ribbon domain-containing protein [Pseudomonas putida]
MTVTLCKSCNQPVDHDAIVCPNCGEDHPAVNTARQLKVIAGVGGVLVLVLALFSGWNNTAPAPVPPIFAVDESVEVRAPRSPVKVQNGQLVYYVTLGMTPKHYADRVNATFKALDKPFAIDPTDIETGQALDFLNAALGSYVALTGSVDKETGYLTSIALFASGDDTRASGEEIQLVASVALAGASPDADHEEIIKRFKDMVFNQEPYRHGHVEFKAGVTQMMGAWFSADPIQPD